MPSEERRIGLALYRARQRAIWVHHHAWSEWLRILDEELDRVL